MENRNDIYPTRNTPLAAWLLSLGFPILDTDFSNPGAVVFFFPNDTKAIKEAIRAWNTDQAFGNVQAFFGKYRELIERIKLGV